MGYGEEGLTVLHHLRRAGCWDVADAIDAHYRLKYPMTATIAASRQIAQNNEEKQKEKESRAGSGEVDEEGVGEEKRTRKGSFMSTTTGSAMNTMNTMNTMMSTGGSMPKTPTSTHHNDGAMTTGEGGNRRDVVTYERALAKLTLEQVLRCNAM